MSDLIEGEEWRPIAGFPYEASSLGRIRRTEARNNTYAGKILRPVSVGRYMAVSISSRGDVKLVAIHRLVATAFHGACPSTRHQVAHIDGNALNNRADNVRWATAKENAEDRERHGHTARGERSGTAVLSDALVRAIRESGLSATDTAKKFNLARTTAARVIGRQTWRHIE